MIRIFGSFGRLFADGRVVAGSNFVDIGEFVDFFYSISTCELESWNNALLLRESSSRALAETTLTLPRLGSLRKIRDLFLLRLLSITTIPILAYRALRSRSNTKRSPWSYSRICSSRFWPHQPRASFLISLALSSGRATKRKPWVAI